MSSDRALDGIYLVLVLVMAVSALAARRLPLATLVRSALGWLAIGLAVYIGVAHRYELAAAFAKVTAALGIEDQSVDGSTVRIRQSPDGHFWANVTLNGLQRRMLIDSGATVTALSEATAKAAEVDTGGSMFPVLVDTANGSITAKRAKVKRLAVGPLRMEDLSVLVSPSFGEMDVLGMNFLSRLGSWRVEGNMLVLEPKRASGDSANTER